MHFYCYAVIPDANQRHEVKKGLRHHNIMFTEECNRLSVDIECVSYRTVEAIAGLFDSVEHTERGFTVLDDKGG